MDAPMQIDMSALQLPGGSDASYFVAGPCKSAEWSVGSFRIRLGQSSGPRIVAIERYVERKWLGERRTNRDCTGDDTRQPDRERKRKHHRFQFV